MPDLLIAVLSSAVVSSLVAIFGSWLQQRGKRKDQAISRDQSIADLFYEELKTEIKQMQKQLNDADHRADKWQEQYYQLYAKYQIVKSHYELATRRIDELTKALQELKNIIETKERTS